jgi:OmpA-OmpF porin, OOP family
VKKFLVKSGIPADRINASGKGSADPVTGDKCPKSGKETAANKKLVKCLAPDRRVEITIHRK